MQKIISYSILLFLLLSSPALFAQANKDAQLADQYMNNYEFEKAAALYEKAYDRDPFGVYQSYLRCLISMKNYTEAEKLVKKTIKKNPANIAYQVDLGNVCELQGDQNKAKQVYDKTIKSLTPDQGQILALANAFISHQNWDYALNTYLAGKQLMKGIYSFLFETAEIYYQKQDYEKMIEEYLTAVGENQINQQAVLSTLQSRLGNDPDSKRSDLLRIALLRRIQRNPDATVFSEMLIWLYVQQKDFESAFMQARALDKRQREDGSRLMSLANLSETNLDYDAAIKCYQYVIEKGTTNLNYIPARIGLLNVRNRKITESGTYTNTDLIALESEYKKTLAELGKDANTASLVRGLSHLQVFYLDKSDEPIQNLEETIAIPDISKQTQAECKLELGDIYLFTGNVWDSDLFYAQVDKAFKNDAIGQEAKFRRARLDYFRGDFTWSQAQLDVLKSATSQLIANDALALSLTISDNMGPDSTNDALTVYSRADLLSYRNHNDDALALLDSLIRVYPSHSLVPWSIYKKALIMDAKKNYTEEDSLLSQVVEKYSDGVLADDALFQRAKLYDTKLSDPTKAKQLYEDLLTKYPGSLFVVDARKRFRALRGDVIN